MKIVRQAELVGRLFTQFRLAHLFHGRVKRRRLLAAGLDSTAIEQRYSMSRRIEAEEQTLASAERVITSTHQEIEEQYELYDHYQPDQMRVIPPGTDVLHFHPPQGDEWQNPIAEEICRFLRDPQKPIILALSRPDTRKNIGALVSAYGDSEELQAAANLLVVAGNRDDISELDEGAQEVLTELVGSEGYQNIPDVATQKKIITFYINQFKQGAKMMLIAVSGM